MVATHSEEIVNALKKRIIELEKGRIVRDTKEAKTHKEKTGEKKTEDDSKEDKHKEETQETKAGKAREE